MQQDKESLNITYNHELKKVKGYLNCLEFENDGHFITFIPSLNLSAYGRTLEDAHKMMKEVIINDFCETLISQPLEKVLSDLRKLGWKSSPFFKKELSNNAHIDRNGILKDFDLAEDTKINEILVAV